MSKKNENIQITIRECTWVNGKAVMWQAHAHRIGSALEYPIISGLPAQSPKAAKWELNKSIADYREIVSGSRLAMEKIKV